VTEFYRWGSVAFGALGAIGGGYWYGHRVAIRGDPWRRWIIWSGIIGALLMLACGLYWWARSQGGRPPGRLIADTFLTLAVFELHFPGYAAGCGFCRRGVLAWLIGMVCVSWIISAVLCVLYFIALAKS
jgi:hypothetical protein